MITAEPEAEAAVSVEAAARSPSDSGEAGTLVEVSFQKNPRHKYKYLEGEPKILGITEIAITVFFIGWRISFYLEAYAWTTNTTILLSSIGIIAGSVAIAAQNLHLPTLKACLGMQVVTSVAYFVCIIITLNEQHFHPGRCWTYFDNYHEQIPSNSTCLHTEKLFNQLILLDELLETVQIVLAITLAAYCCKVIPCCSPRSNVPVIVMTPPAASE
ncbi:uncharacterized protein LOC100001422 isoform 2 [Danio rerio]|uniref:Si:ch211-212k18.8 n=1 Tax=Danio rerio TaxID=7955 RepID=A0A8M9QHJ9_DANRE|nr:uncharacterized protein LOC100001422 isoform 2 [Danio rerio]|eukprot:XP_005172279.1 uncharacterized protein si:ch211-212k18.8 isoform X2 [Danio rerio]